MANYPTAKEIIEVLEIVKHDHYDGGYEGLTGCPAIYGRGDCDCGADEVNIKINEFVKRLQIVSPPGRVDMVKIELLAEIETNVTVLPEGKAVLINCRDACLLIQMGLARLPSLRPKKLPA